MTARVPVRRALAVVIAIQLVALYIVMHNSSWVYDDNFFLVLAGQEGFTWHWLTSVQFEHWDIALHAVTSLQHWLFYLDYRWGLAVLLLVLGSSTYVFERVLATVVADRRITLAFAAWFGLSILWARPLQWWIAGVQYIPYTLFDLLCLYGFLRYQAGREGRWLWLSGGALAAALLFYEKPAYMLGYLVLIRILLLSEDLHPRAVASAFWRERGMWVLYVAIVGVWAAGYLHSGAYSSHGSVHLSQYLSYFRILWLETLVPSLASVTIPAAGLDALQTLFVVFAQLLVVVCVVLSLRRKRSAWRAWGFLLVVVLFNGVLVAHSRIPIFGPTIANDPRYLIDYSWLVPLTLCAAFTRGAVLRPRAPSPRASITLSTREHGGLAAAGLIAVYAAVAIASAVHVEAIWGGPQARRWDDNVRAGIASLERGGPRPMVAGNATPFVVMAGFVAPYNRLARVLPMYVGPIQVDGPLDAPLVSLGEDGRVQRVSASPAPGSEGFAGLLAHGRVVVAGGRVVAYGGEACVIADGAPATVERTEEGLPASGPYYVRAEYRVWRRLVVGLAVETGSGYAVGGGDESIELRPGAGASIAWVGPLAPRRVRVTVPPLSTLCLRRLDVVTLATA